jgi:transcriptional repressor NrdR
MRCPKCLSQDTKVLDTRSTDQYQTLRRRRQCLSCHWRFLTIEDVCREELVVVKRDGRREPFARQKLLAGIQHAIQKRPVERERIERMLGTIVADLEKQPGHEIHSRLIGQLVMDHLRQLDAVAYVRFASVYKEFRDIHEFKDAIRQLECADEKEAFSKASAVPTQIAAPTSGSQ